ncbi:MAG: CYTH domain-containing protein [Chloroflexota bacterium]
MSGDGLEIERKYLLAGVPAEAALAVLGARPVRIEQVYLRAEDDWVRRVRRTDADGAVHHVLTRKRDVAGIVREELETDLTPEEYGRLLADADPARRTIRKTRHVVPYGRWTLELDVFDDPPGLVLLEVELDDADQVPELPPPIAALVVHEVSTEPAYANYMLALLPEGGELGPRGGRQAGLTRPANRGTLASMTPKPPDDDRPDELPPTEAARARRRDHDAGAAERSGMRTGLAKQFKQVLDAQARRGRAASGRGEDEGAGEDEPERPAKKRGHPGDHAARTR